MEDTEIRRKKKESLLSRIWENSDYAALAAVGALPTWFEFDPHTLNWVNICFPAIIL